MVYNALEKEIVPTWKDGISRDNVELRQNDGTVYLLYNNSY
jgi:hypothetical protein